MKPKKKSKRILRIILAVGAVVATALAGYYLFTQNSAQAAADLKPSQTVTVFVGELSAKATAGGRLLPQREAQLALGIAGQVKAVYVPVGDKVQAGDVLIQLETGSLQRAVRSVEQTLAIQKANLAELRQGASEEEIASAEATLDSAKASLANAQAGLISANSALTKAELSRDALADADVTTEASLKSARASLSSAQAQLAALLEGADAETVEQTRLNWEQAKNSLWNAQLERDAVNGRPGTPGYMKHQMGIAVANAEIAVRVAEINYLQAQEGATDEAIAAARAAVASAEAQVANAQAGLDDIDDQIAQAKASVTQAEASVAQAEAGVLQAEAAVAQAEANLAMLLAGPSEEKIAVAEAQVAQARISLEDAQDNLAKASLTASMDSTVTSLGVEPGETVNPGQIVLVLSDLTALEVEVNLDETDIAQVSTGQEARISLDAFPGIELIGEVTAIAPVAQTQTGVVLYPVTVRLMPGDLPLRPGMTADVDITTASQEDVLIVPLRAVHVEEGHTCVDRLAGGQVERVEVALGMMTETEVEITGGLAKGDVVVVVPSAQGSAGGGMFGMFGGGE